MLELVDDVELGSLVMNGFKVTVRMSVLERELFFPSFSPNVLKLFSLAYNTSFPTVLNTCSISHEFFTESHILTNLTLTILRSRFSRGTGTGA
jgi:hypothetical protein